MEAKFDSLAKLAGRDFSLPLIFVLVFVLFEGISFLFHAVLT